MPRYSQHFGISLVGQYSIDYAVSGFVEVDGGEGKVGARKSSMLHCWNRRGSSYSFLWSKYLVPGLAT